jgi:hypothetical protein
MDMRFVIKAASIIILSLFCPAYAQQGQSDDDPEYNKYVIALPTVDKVEILAVTGFPPNEWKKVDCTKPDIICGLSVMPYKILGSKSLRGEDANMVSMMWRRLRRGNGAGCFAPAYLLRFYQNDKLFLAAEVCFHCCNIKLPGEGIASMCGNWDAVTRFKEFLTTELPLPNPDDKK